MTHSTQTNIIWHQWKHGLEWKILILTALSLEAYLVNCHWGLKNHEEVCMTTKICVLLVKDIHQQLFPLLFLLLLQHLMLTGVTQVLMMRQCHGLTWLGWLLTTEMGLGLETETEEEGPGQNSRPPTLPARHKPASHRNTWEPRHPNTRTGSWHLMSNASMNVHVFSNFTLIAVVLINLSDIFYLSEM